MNAFQGRGLPALAAALIVGAAVPAFAGFSPANAPYGFFGGGAACSKPNGKTPVVFVHGNANGADDWNAALEGYRAAGYDDCRLFGVTWLSPERRKDPFGVTHDASGAAIVADFIEDVKRFTGSARVDVVAHSMGVTEALAAIDARGQWPSVRKFVAIAGAMRGLESCRLSPLATCAGQFKADPEKFGFLPSDAPPADVRQEKNKRMGEGGFRDFPRKAEATSFYSIFDGRDDEILCMAPAPDACLKTALFAPAPNVVSQLTVATPGGRSYHHFQVRDLTGPLQRKMLETGCRESECAAP